MTTAADAPAGRRFYKLSGSGNDFVFFDVRAGGADLADDPAAIAALCSRGQGVGADGVVFLDAPEPGLVRIVYLNSDGSRPALCGNATLCTARLAVHLGLFGEGEPFVIRTDAGDLTASVAPGGDPSFELAPVVDLIAAAPGGTAWGALELAISPRVGYADTGVPHLVVRVDDVDSVDLDRRGPVLRAPGPERPAGANVNFVSPGADGAWRMRTYERGVEAETLACGTGAVACAAVLHAWGVAGRNVVVRTRSGRRAVVTLPVDPDRGPQLAGEGRLVYEGTLHAWR